MCLENRRTNIRCRLPKIMLTFLCSFEDKWFRPFENERLIKIAFDQHNQIYSGSKKKWKVFFALVVFDGCEERNSIWTKRRILLFLDVCVLKTKGYWIIDESLQHVHFEVHSYQNVLYLPCRILTRYWIFTLFWQIFV